MEIAALPIPETLREHYLRSGITSLYPPQEECIRKGIFEGRNMLVAIPTASGKTLVAEMAMHHHIARGGRCLYIVPLKALASEKFEEFRRKGPVTGIATGDYDRREEALGRCHIIVATSEKVDSLLRNRTPWLSGITLLVVDEVHLLDDEGRGPTLEMVVTKLRARNPAMQLLALSATIGNPKELAGWLDAEVVTGSWRPVELREGIYYRGAIHFSESERRVEGVSRFDDLNLCLDTVAEGGQCLVFVSSRRNAEAFAKRAAGALACHEPDLDTASRELGSLAETEMDRTLAACVGQGAAFHHAGLRREQRAIVERGFRAGKIRCIASTPTLAAGLNLPARRVIIRDYLRYQTGEGMVPIPVREYHQMAGRAGRPGLDPYGEAVLIAKDTLALQALADHYVNSPPEEVTSRCTTSAALCTHILSLVATGFASSRDEILRFMDRTLLAYQKKSRGPLEGHVDRILAWLAEVEMLTCLPGHLSATEYGSLVSRLYLDPRSADLILQALSCVTEYSDTGLLQLICSTPDMLTLYVRQGDIPLLDRFVGEHGEDLWVEVPMDDEEAFMEFYRSLKTALVLQDWAAEVGEATICERYGINPGDIYGLTEGVGWLLHGAARISRAFAPIHATPVAAMETRMRYGVKPELLPLVSLRGIGRVRARRLFNQGITSPQEVAEAGLEVLTPLLGRAVAAQVLSDIGGRGRKRGSAGEVQPQPPDPQTRLPGGD
jgi:ATP-dependent DNA helicase